MCAPSSVKPAPSIEEFCAPINASLGKLPADVRVPDFEGKPITLRDVATYSPGLPGWPADMPPLGKTFPDYPVARLYRALSATKLD